MKSRLLAVLTLLSLTVCHFSVAGDLALEDLIKPINIQQVKISPGGDKLAVVTLEQGERVLALMDLEPLKTTFVLRFNGEQEVGEFHWANNERIITSVWVRKGWLDDPRVQGYMFAIDHDGRNGKTVFGWAQNFDGGQKNSRIKKQKAHPAHARVISALPHDEKHILISTSPWKRGGLYWYPSTETIGKVLKLNVYNGRTKKITSLPSRGGRAFATDKGEILFANGLSGDGISEFYQRKNDEWVRLGDIDEDYYAAPVGYSSDGKSAFLIAYAGADKSRLLRLNLMTGEETEIFAHPRVNISDVTNYPGTEDPMVVHTEDGLPEEHWLDQEHKATRYLRGIHKAFKDYRVRVDSTTTDGKVAIVSVEGDNMPSDYFLVNFESKSAAMLMSSAGWLDPASMLTTESFDMKARDGLDLQGYLTFPKSGREGLPMIVRPHGGPTSRDYWEYDREAQIFANEGFLVLSINFRGSSGYGSSFSARSDGEWGGLVQDDIADATRWAVEQGYADAKRVCIYGGSFGAYSALMGVVREPDLYQCAAGFAGVYDLELMYQKGDIPTRRSGVAYLEEALGTDEDALQQFSPTYHASKIKVPVFIAHGGEDVRAPIEHAYALEKSLRAANVEVQTQYYKKGGHGYYTEAANMELYTGLLSFLNKHIGEK